MVSLPVLRSDALTPFVGTKRMGVTRALGALLGLNDGERAAEVPVSWRQRASREGHGPVIVVELGEPMLAVVALGGLTVAAADPAADLASVPLNPRFGFEGPEGRVLVERMKAALSRSSAALTDQVGAVVRALRQMEGFRDKRDEEFRKISSAPAGTYGTLRLGYRCNQDCHFCWQDREAPSPPDEEYFAWLDQMAAAGVKHLNITGGEPTTYAVLVPLIERATQLHGMAVGIQSNAISLAQPKYLAKLVKAGLTAVMTSYHSADSDVSDEMTRAPGTHVKTREGIANALAAGMVVTMTCVVERRNLPALEDQARDIVTRFVLPFPENPPQRVTYAHPTSYFEEGLWDESQHSFDEVRPNLLAAARVIHAAGVPVQITGTCGFPRCMLHGAPELQAQQPLQREIFDPQQLGHLRYGKACETCTEKPLCFGLRPEYLARFGERGLLPFD